jgi:uncharacterized protein YrrD
MGLQTGSKLAATKMPVIDPSNLKIIAYEVEGPLLSEDPCFLRIADVREISNIGMIIDSSDEFIGIDDVIKVKEIYNLNFGLIGLNVIDQKNKKLGKVESYNIDSDSFIIQQLNITQGFIKSLSEAGLLIHRSQIVEINDHAIIVKSAAKKLEPIIKPGQLTYINPFRSTNTASNKDN